jgi:hypothetical protein
MSALKALRDQLAADLAPLGVAVYASWPKSITLPCAYVMPPLNNNYIVGGPNFGEYTVSIDVVILADHADVTESLEILETLLEAALVNSADWTLTGVEPPSPITVTESGADYLGAVVHLSKPVRLS